MPHLNFDINLPDRSDEGVCHVEFDATFDPLSIKRWSVDPDSVCVWVGDEQEDGDIRFSDLDKNSQMLISTKIGEIVETLESPIPPPPPLWVFSGKVALCEIGKPTTLTDRHGRQLFTGDIVVIWTEDESGILKHTVDNLTCVIELTEEKDLSLHGKARPGPWVMGIRDVDLSDSDWRVLRVKQWSDVIEGEHWTEYGFNFNHNPQ